LETESSDDGCSSEDGNDEGRYKHTRPRLHSLTQSLQRISTCHLASALGQPCMMRRQQSTGDHGQIRL
jgi:hypothetical protein